MSEEKINALMETKLGEEAFAAERIYFVKTDRMHNPRKVNPIKLFPGDLPVLVSAPHAVRHIRHKKIKPSDEFTGSMAFLLNKLTGCYSIAVTKLYGGDPNFDSPCIYKETLKTLVAENRFSLVIDLHGASREHTFDVDLGTKRGASLLGNTRHIEDLKKRLKEFGIGNISENYFTVSGNSTVTDYVSSQLKVPCIQIEINKKYRVPHQNPRDYSILVGALAAFIEDTSKIRKVPRD